MTADWPGNDEDAGEIRALAAQVNYDGSLTLLLEIPGEPDLVEHTIPGDRRTVLMTFHGQSKPIDLAGGTTDDRYCQPLVARGVRRLNEEMARQRERLGRRMAEWPDA